MENIHTNTCINLEADFRTKSLFNGELFSETDLATSSVCRISINSKTHNNVPAGWQAVVMRDARAINIRSIALASYPSHTV